MGSFVGEILRELLETKFEILLVLYASVLLYLKTRFLKKMLSLNVGVFLITADKITDPSSAPIMKQPFNLLNSHF